MKKKILSRLAAILVILSLVLGGAALLNFLLVDDTASYTRLMEHEFYGQEGIDVLLLGPSHCYRGIDPALVGELTGKRVFNASTSAQPLDGSLALLKEAVKYYDLEEVYLELSAESVQGTDNNVDRTDLTKIYLIADYMRLSPNKLQLLLGASSSEHYMNSFFPARRHWRRIFNVPQMLRLARQKCSRDYRGYAYVFAASKDEEYAGLGYVASNVVVPAHGNYLAYDSKRIDESTVSDDWKSTLREIVGFCAEHGIKLTLFDAPISDGLLCSWGNYDEHIAFVNGMLQGTGVSFAEFNLLREEVFSNQQDYYKDFSHLNRRGAEAFSAVFAQYVKGELPPEAFYPSVEEKLRSEPPEYYGVTYVDDETEQLRTLRLVSNREDFFEYRIALESAEGEILIRDYDSSSELSIPLSQLKGAGGLVVSFRPAGETAEGERVVYKKPQS